MNETAAIIGTGLIGRAWAIAFARGGWDVRLYDPIAGAVDRSLATIDLLLAHLDENGLLAEGAAKVRVRMRPSPDLTSALAGIAWVQESAPEQLEVKKALWADLDRLAAPEVILSSSTSALVPSSFTEELPGRARCLVSHPLNPPYVIPAVELCPAPWTSLQTMARAEQVMRGIGQAVIVMRREIEGFVMNRLQAALVEEAFKLVSAGICGPEDVDIGLREGLALRWSFMGPFETGDLNANGIRDYITRYRGVFDSIHAKPLPRPDWTGPVLDAIEQARSLRLLRSEVAHRQRWRDRRLMSLMRHKREARKTIGD